MTKEEFEWGFAERSKLTVEQLYELGLHAYPCDCDYEKCEGWQILHDDLRFERINELRRNPE